MRLLQDRTLLITGACGGIGQVLCHELAEGNRILALDREAEGVEALVSGLRALGYRAEACVADVTDGAAVQAAVAAAVERAGPVDVLVNNAGGAAALCLAKTSREDWAADLELNLSGPFHCVEAVRPSMIERGQGVILNVGSVNGVLALGHPAYSAAKAGLIHYTKSLALEFGRFGLRANVILPGTVRTQAWAERVARHPEIFEGLKKWYPLERVVEPQDLARAVEFLASPWAAAITGAVLPVDCGLLAGNRVMAGELTLEAF